MTPAGQDIPSTRPYLIRALYEWCTENGFSPYLAVQVDASVRVPMDHVKNGEIVIPVSHVTAIYARENGQGMAFPPPVLSAAASAAPAAPPASRPEPVLSALASVDGDAPAPSSAPRTPGRGKLTRVK